MAHQFKGLRGVALLEAVDQFLSQWFGSDEASTEISKLDYDIPEEVIYLYELADKWPQARIYGTQDNLIPKEELSIENGRLTIIAENQGVWTIEAMIGNTTRLFYNDGMETGEVEADIGQVLTTFLLREMIYGSPCWCSPDSAPKWTIFKKELKRLWDEGVFWFFGETTDPHHEFYVAENNLLVMEQEGGVSIVVNDPELLSLRLTLFCHWISEVWHIFDWHRSFPLPNQSLINELDFLTLNFLPDAYCPFCGTLNLVSSQKKQTDGKIILCTSCQKQIS